ncbi:MAG TPA: zf-HC2 domain-containing protein [Gemmatimonadales bacterium]|nr:zf-HC2 domain-containing protein [Gemmatimonadales bacterium]
MGTGQDVPRHLASGEIAAFVEGRLATAERSRVAAHLVQCDACRDELIEVSRLFHTRPRPRRRYMPIGAVAAVAAAALLLVVWPRHGTQSPMPSGYREPPVTTTVAPVVVAPRGVIRQVGSFVWNGVSGADHYRLTVFDDVGRVAWGTETSDTSAVMPAGVRLQPGMKYLWKVEAQTSWNRWVGSDLVDFSIGSHRP